MAVIVKYIVVRNGEEKMTFVTKKEADAYDKMLDIADNLFDFLDGSDITIDEEQKEAISLLMAEHRDKVMPILRGISPKKKPVQAAQAKATAAKPSKVPAKKPNPGKPAGKPAAKSPAKNPARSKAAARKKS